MFGLSEISDFWGSEFRGSTVSQNKTCQCAWPLQKSIFRKFHDSEADFYIHTKTNIIFWIKKESKRVWGRSGEALKMRNIQQRIPLRRKCDSMELIPSKVGKIVLINGKITVSMYVDVMSQNLKKVIRNLYVGRWYIFRPSNDLKHTSKISTKTISQKTRLRYWNGHHKD
ncbi:hypothetical protein AVEN_29113-1 [Araneus ventricosus]|uniref:Uncharacterized protein n=1 Tax=Araneus ventricosus TaxID=182803 RepID=A0A4Y2ALK5_ARAVE|nr:hypothetical protein AVEN_29113-1 [Araneus ventricosus]